MIKDPCNGQRPENGIPIYSIVTEYYLLVNTTLHRETVTESLHICSS